MGLSAKPFGKNRSRWDKMLNELKKNQENNKKSAPRKEKKMEEQE